MRNQQTTQKFLLGLGGLILSGIMNFTLTLSIVGSIIFMLVLSRFAENNESEKLVDMSVKHKFEFVTDMVGDMLMYFSTFTLVSITLFNVLS